MLEAARRINLNPPGGVSLVSGPRGDDNFPLDAHHLPKRGEDSAQWGSGVVHNGTVEMKTKVLFWIAVLFLGLGLKTSDGILFYFFSIHFFMLFIGLFVHQRAYEPKSKTAVEHLPANKSVKR
jgi:hypothetical protein